MLIGKLELEANISLECLANARRETWLERLVTRENL